MLRKKVAPVLLAAFGVLLAAGTAWSQAWPAPGKAITFINPFPPGGAVDAFGRPLARQLGQQLGVPTGHDHRDTCAAEAPGAGARTERDEPGDLAGAEAAGAGGVGSEAASGSKTST